MIAAATGAATALATTRARAVTWGMHGWRDSKRSHDRFDRISPGFLLPAEIERHDSFFLGEIDSHETDH
jgi:hypothetical protein